MEGQPKGIGTTGDEPGTPVARGGGSVIWAALALVAIALAAASVAVRLAGGHNLAGLGMDEILMLAAAAAFAVLAVQVLIRARRVDAPAPASAELKEVLESAGPALVATDCDGRMTYVNPAAERLFGYHAAELLGQAWDTMEILAPGEETRRCGDGEAQRPRKTARAGAFGLAGGPFRLRSCFTAQHGAEL